jgi:hypothetical protein
MEVLVVIIIIVIILAMIIKLGAAPLPSPGFHLRSSMVFWSHKSANLGRGHTGAPWRYTERQNDVHHKKVTTNH